MGLSNISFSFRGNNRGARSDSLGVSVSRHPCRDGHGIVNAGQLAIYDDIPADLRDLVEDVILNRRDDATERLLEAAGSFKGEKNEKKRICRGSEAPVGDRLTHALVNGMSAHILEDAEEARLAADRP